MLNEKLFNKEKRMINFKNSLKKILAGAFGIFTMLSPLQSAQSIDFVSFTGFADKNDMIAHFLPFVGFVTKNNLSEDDIKTIVKLNGKRYHPYKLKPEDKDAILSLIAYNVNEIRIIIVASIAISVGCMKEDDSLSLSDISTISKLKPSKYFSHSKYVLDNELAEYKDGVFDESIYKELLTSQRLGYDVLAKEFSESSARAAFRYLFFEILCRPVRDIADGTWKLESESREKICFPCCLLHINEESLSKFEGDLFCVIMFLDCIQSKMSSKEVYDAFFNEKYTFESRSLPLERYVEIPRWFRTERYYAITYEDRTPLSIIYHLDERGEESILGYYYNVSEQILSRAGLTNDFFLHKLELYRTLIADIVDRVTEIYELNGMEMAIDDAELACMREGQFSQGICCIKN